MFVSSGLKYQTPVLIDTRKGWRCYCWRKSIFGVDDLIFGDVCICQDCCKPQQKPRNRVILEEWIFIHFAGFCYSCISWPVTSFVFYDDKLNSSVAKWFTLTLISYFPTQVSELSCIHKSHTGHLNVKTSDLLLQSRMI
jgi:hypothetical protein